VLAIVNPMDHGAVGDGVADDQKALEDSIDALPAAGGVVYFPKGATFSKSNLLAVTKPHVKFWAPDGQATLSQKIGGQRRHQSMLCQSDGCGFFGVKFTSDATQRFDALEDNQISADHVHLVEVVGCDIAGSAAAGVFLFGSTEHYIEGNYVHHTYADHIHHTDGATQSWVWGNYVFNEAPSNGDNALVCVTYGHSSPRCGDMEWWNNTLLHTEGGRGYSVIGGDGIFIHDNLAMGIYGAGIIVASETSYDSASSRGIRIQNNVVTGCGHGIPNHTGILISGLNAAAEPLTDIVLTDNVSAGNPNGNYRTEGAFENVTSSGLVETSGALPVPLPTVADVHLADTSILRTRDVSHVAEASRPGLYRIHVRQAPSGAGFEERFEYVVKGPPAALDAFVLGRTRAGDYLSEQRGGTDAGTAYALVLTRAPVPIPDDISAVAFREMRAGDQSGALSWLWKRVDSGVY
jgi:hypothetical protein